MGTTIAIFLAGLLSGLVDAIAGGGGLIMLPTLMLSGLPVSAAVATNKLCGSFGTFTSTWKFAAAQQVNWQVCGLMGIPAIVGAAIGSRSLSLLPRTWAEPIVIALMIGITLLVLLKPELGQTRREMTPLSRRQTLLLMFWGWLIGFHDGFFGPGAGTFLMFALLSICQFDFLQATGSTKVVNFLTNITALISFLLLGTVQFQIGLVAAIGVTIGAYLGAGLATRRGAKLIKPLFVLVSTGLISKLLWEYLVR